MCYLPVCLSVKEVQVAYEGKPLDEVISEVLKGRWDHERTKFSLPPLMTLVSTLMSLYSTSSDALYCYGVVLVVIGL